MAREHEETDIALSEAVADDLFPGDGEPPQFDSDIQLFQRNAMVDDQLDGWVTELRGPGRGETIRTTQQAVEVTEDAR